MTCCFWKAFPFAGLILLFLSCHDFVQAQPRIRKVGIAISDRVERRGLPPHLNELHGKNLRNLYDGVKGQLNALGRFETVAWNAVGEGRKYEYIGPGEVDFVAHVTVYKLEKIYRNETLYYNPRYTVDFKQDGEKSYEIISRPAVTSRLKMALIDQKKGKVIWSAMRDSTVIVPHDSHTYLYNPSKYPGLTHPALIRTHLSDIIRLQSINTSVERSMVLSDRWFVSSPQKDTDASQELLAALLDPFLADLDGNLPLEGRIESILPLDKKGRTQVLLNIGALDGLFPRLRLEVWRPEPSDQKVGQVEIVKVDSSSAVAMVRKIEKKLRKRGEGPNPDDRVISRKRPSLLH